MSGPLPDDVDIHQYLVSSETVNDGDQTHGDTEINKSVSELVAQENDGGGGGQGDVKTHHKSSGDILSPIQAQQMESRIEQSDLEDDRLMVLDDYRTENDDRPILAQTLHDTLQATGAALRSPTAPETDPTSEHYKSASMGMMDSKSPEKAAEERQLQAMAFLLRQHQLEHGDNDDDPDNSWFTPSTSAPLQAQPVDMNRSQNDYHQSSSSTHHQHHHHHQGSSRLSHDGQDSNNAHLSSIALGKRKADTQDVDTNASRTDRQHNLQPDMTKLASQSPTGVEKLSHRTSYDPLMSGGGGGGGPDDLNNVDNGQGSTSERKRRRKRIRKPLDHPSSKPLPGPLASDTSPGASGRTVKDISAHMDTLQFKKQEQRRWSHLQPYTTMVGMVIKMLLSDSWDIMTESVARHSLPGEEKDQRKVKQTWANEQTRFKNHAAKGRLVTLRALNSSWPWSLKEKEQLWKTGIALCADRADWDNISAEVTKVAHSLGEPGADPQECKAEWENVLRYEYMDDDPIFPALGGEGGGPHQSLMDASQGVTTTPHHHHHHHHHQHHQDLGDMAAGTEEPPRDLEARFNSQELSPRHKGLPPLLNGTPFLPEGSSTEGLIAPELRDPHSGGDGGESFTLENGAQVDDQQQQEPTHGETNGAVDATGHGHDGSGDDDDAHHHHHLLNSVMVENGRHVNQPVQVQPSPCSPVAAPSLERPTTTTATATSHQELQSTSEPGHVGLDGHGLASPPSPSPPPPLERHDYIPTADEQLILEAAKAEIQ